MLRNYFTIALRFMIRQKGFSFINIAGLTLGIASSLLILLYILDEFSFDAFHTGVDRMYRITQEGKMEGKRIHSAYTCVPLAATLKNEVPQVESVVRLANWATFPMRYKTRAFTEPNLLLADSNFFRFFNFKLIEGDPTKVLRGKARLVLTESAARRYFDYKGFGTSSPIGKQIVLAQGVVAEVTGIAEDPPLQSHFHFSAVLSLDSWTEIHQDGWITQRVITYAKLKPEGTESELASALTHFTDKYIARELKEVRDLDINLFRVQGNELKFGIQHVPDIHLWSDLTDEIEPNGNITYIYLFISIASFIVLLACINFMNLSTARSAARAKEIGVRKVVGAPGVRLITQFLMESYLYIFVAVILALFILMVAIGPFNYFTGKALESATFLTGDFLAGLFAFTFSVGLLAGSYPAFYLTNFNPIEVLKGRTRRKFSGYGIRNILVVFQFFISVSLIIATITVYQQLRYFQTKEVGFDKENVVNLIHTANLGERGHDFKAKLLQNESIISASYSNRLPPNIDWQYIFRPEEQKKDYLLNVYEVDYDHLKALKFEMVKGRFFSQDYSTDTAAVILNETAARRMGIDKTIDQKIYSQYGRPGGSVREVIGIIHDFNFQSLKDSIQPAALVLGKEPNWEMAVRIRKGKEAQAIDHLKETWKHYAPNVSFEYTFLDNNFEAKLETERRIAILFLLFTSLAIFIACLGLYGLATFTAEQRTKEIGIRKVLGASESNIVAMLNKDFLKLVVIANLIAWPIVAWLMVLWLDQFAYHISPPWWSFPVTIIASSFIAFLSVTWRAFKAAYGNPVDSLRNE
jgi:putative ABC transport system permease protein